MSENDNIAKEYGNMRMRTIANPKGGISKTKTTLNIDKEEAENIENQAAVEEKKQAGEIDDKVTVKQPKLGQPRKYDEPTKHVSFSLPLSVIEDLRIIAGIEKTNQTQVILGLIRDKLEREADKIKKYKELFH